MSRVVAAMSDKLLGVVLREKRAGACLPPEYCYCKNHWVYKNNCAGVCVKTNARC